MKKRILALLLALSMTAALASCATEAPPEGGGDEEGGDVAATLTMGFIGPLTGGAAIYGQSALRGAQIAAEEITATGEVQIVIEEMDDEHDAEKSVAAYNQLVDLNVQMIVGTVTTGPGIAVAAEAFVDRMFMLSPSASSPEVIAGKDNIYQICFTDPNQGSASAQFIADNALASKVAVIYNNGDAYSTGIYQTFAEKATELGLEIVSETTFTDSTIDFSVQLTEAQAAGAELIFLPIYYTPASLILQQANAMDFDVNFFGCDGLDGILGIEGFDTTLAEGVMLLTPFAADAEDAATQAFVTKYQDLYDETPSQFAADGYDCVYALYQAITEAAAANGKTMTEMAAMSYAELCDILIATFSAPDFVFDGLTGVGMTWDATGEVTKAPKAVVIQDGAYLGM